MDELIRDTTKGWVICIDTATAEPRWRSTIKAVDDLDGKIVDWFVVPRRAHVMTVAGNPVGKLWYYPNVRQWSARITGFEFFRFNRVLKQDMYQPVSAFPTIREAKTFVEAILIQSGAIIGGTTKTGRRTFRGRISVQ